MVSANLGFMESFLRDCIYNFICHINYNMVPNRTWRSVARAEWPISVQSPAHHEIHMKNLHIKRDTDEKRRKTATAIF